MNKREFIHAENVFSILRAATVLAGVLGTLIAAWLGLIGVNVFEAIGTDIRENLLCFFCGLWGCAVLVAICVCCYAALVVFFRMCGRLRVGSAFTDENARAMERMAALCAVCGGLLLATCVLYACTIFEGVFVLPQILLGLFLCAFFGVALLAKALAILVRRAAELQRENDLTV